MKIKKVSSLWILFSAILFILTACGSNKPYFYQTDIEETNTYFEDNKKGFVLIVTDNDEYFVPAVKKVAEDEKVKIIMYNPYQSDGKNDNEGSSIFPDSSDIKGDALYYLEKNEVVGELEVNKFEDSQLTEELRNFINVHK